MTQFEGALFPSRAYIHILYQNSLVKMASSNGPSKMSRLSRVDSAISLSRRCSGGTSSPEKQSPRPLRNPGATSAPAEARSRRRLEAGKQGWPGAIGDTGAGTLARTRTCEGPRHNANPWKTLLQTPEWWRGACRGDRRVKGQR